MESRDQAQVAGKTHNAGRFDDGREAARAFDTAARRLRPQGKAHGGKADNNWLRLNFPTAEEKVFAAQQGRRGDGFVAKDPAVEMKAESPKQAVAKYMYM